MSSITEQIMGAWDEDEKAPTEESPEVTEPVATTAEGEEGQDEVVAGDEIEETDEAQEEEVSEEPDEEDEEEEEPSEEEQAEEPAGASEPVAFSSDDPSVLAFLERHDGDIEAALREAVRYESTLGRQGRELGQHRQRIAELEAELEQATLFRQGTGVLSAEQVEWVEEASSSENALGYVQAAVEAGEFDLARAVLDQAQLPAGQVLRVAQAIERAEQLAQPAEEQQPLAHNLLMEVLVEHYPEMPKFENEMVSTMQALGEAHPLVALARSQDPGEAAQGIIGLYEIARAKTATVTSTREQVTKSRKATADAVRTQAQVSSNAASPQRASAPRTDQLMPGLTLEALEAEFDAE